MNNRFLTKNTEPLPLGGSVGGGRGRSGGGFGEGAHQTTSPRLIGGEVVGGGGQTSPTLFDTTEPQHRIPDWILEHQPDIAPNLTTCPTCEEPTITTQTGHQNWTIDPTPLTNHEELKLTTQGVETFSHLTDTLGTHTTVWRHWWTTQQWPAHQTTITSKLGGTHHAHHVLPRHRCGHTTGRQPPWETLYRKPPPKNNDNETPPF